MSRPAESSQSDDDDREVAPHTLTPQGTHRYVTDNLWVDYCPASKTIGIALRRTETKLDPEMNLTKWETRELLQIMRGVLYAS